MDIVVTHAEVNKRVIDDLLYVYEMDTYINIKGYLQKLIDLLNKLGYYEDNKTIFPERNIIS